MGDVPPFRGLRGAALVGLGLLALWPGGGLAQGPEDSKPREGQAGAVKAGAPKPAEAKAKDAKTGDATGTKAKAAASRPTSDYEEFQAEFRTGGALKFYQATEELLRAGRFEEALCRYLFLKSRIRGQSLYAGLVVMVDQRLHFLRSQMGLGEGVLTAPPRRRATVRKAKAQPPPLEKKDDKKPSLPADQPEAEKTGGIPAARTPGPGSGPPVKEGEIPPADEKAPPVGPPEEKAAKKEAPPPSSFWERVRRRLMFWK